MAFRLWSKTSATNATADPNINWAEGQLPSTVNDSARAMMAELAKWRDDISGATLLGGNDGINYTMSSSSGFTSASDMNGQIIAFTPQVTNTGPVVVNVDGVGSFGIRSAAIGASGDLPSGAFIAGTPYLALFNSSVGKFFLINTGFQTYSVPVGGVLIDGGDTPPNSCFAFPRGQALSRATYSVLFGRYGTKYGVGDGSTTFNIMNTQGRTIFGYNPSGSGILTTASGGLDGTTLGATGGTQNVVLDITQIPSHNHSGTTGNDSPDHTHTDSTGTTSGTGGVWPGGGSGGVAQSGTTTSGASVRHQHSIPSQGGGLGHVNVPPGIVLNFLVRII